jgi:hypothetical protein
MEITSLTPQNELTMLQNYINHLPNGYEKKMRMELYQTKKKELNKTKKNSNNAAANAFLMSEFGSKNGRTRSTAQTLKFVPPMPSYPPPPPKRKGGRRKRKTMKRKRF